MSPMYIPVVSIISGTVIILSVLRMISDQANRRLAQRPREIDPEILRRLERIEQTVESTAIEVERIAEGNRFVSKLLAERSEPVK
jgi:hypothetical protein